MASLSDAGMATGDATWELSNHRPAFVTSPAIMASLRDAWPVATAVGEVGDDGMLDLRVPQQNALADDSELGPVFDEGRFVGVWDALRVFPAGHRPSQGPMIAWATLFNPDYTRRAIPRHDTWEICPGTLGSASEGPRVSHVATLMLLFRYYEVPGLESSHDLVLVQWLESSAADRSLAAHHNGSRTFTVMRPASFGIVPTYWLSKSRRVIPCGVLSDLRGALWVWNQ